MPRATLLALAILVLPAALRAVEPTVPPEVTACLEKARLEPDSIRGVRFVSRDRAGDAFSARRVRKGQCRGIQAAGPPAVTSGRIGRRQGPATESR